MPPVPSHAPSTRGPWLAAVASAVVVLVLALLAATGVTDSLDASVGVWIRAPEARDVLAPLRQVTDLGSTWAVTSIAVVLLVGGWAVGRPRDALAGAATIAVAAAGIEIVKRIVARARPEILEPILVETGFSFPSGHAANAMVAYGIAAVVVGRTALPPAARLSAQIVLGVVVGLVGISRVWLGVHHPVDVIAGWATGAVAVFAYVALTRPGWPARAAAAVGADPAAPRSGPPETG
jgi:undecaprenyl-diphosphatase